jgi:predicted nucleotidyltransferase
MMAKDKSCKTDMLVTVMPSIEKMKPTIVPILIKNDVKRAAVFGSFARGEAKRDSDVDLVIEFKAKKGLFDFIGLQMELEDALGRKVDLVTYHSLSPHFIDDIMREQVPIL